MRRIDALRSAARAVAALALRAALLACACSCADPTRVPPPVPPGAIPAGAVLGTGAIKGRVAYTGAPREPQPISFSSDAACHKQRQGEPLREDLVVGASGALRYAFVHVAGGLEGRVFAPPEGPSTLDQRGCVYLPHVLGIQVGQPLLILNSDPTLHNVHVTAEQNKAFNFGMSVQGQKATRYFSAPEVMIRAKCDVHPWMISFIGVVAHPFYDVTGEDGRFSIEGLPAGTYVVEAWQESLGARRETVSLSEGDQREVDFTFPG